MQNLYPKQLKNENISLPIVSFRVMQPDICPWDAILSKKPFCCQVFFLTEFYQVFSFWRAKSPLHSLLVRYCMIFVQVIRSGQIMMICRKQKNYRYMYKVFHLFRQAKFVHGSSILGFSKFLLMPQLPQKIKFN